MSEKVQELQRELSELLVKRAEWKQREDTAFEAVEDAIDKGSDIAEASAQAEQARFAIKHIEQRVGEKRAELKVAREAQTRAEFQKKLAEAQKMRKEADKVIAEQRQRLVETAKDCYEQSAEAAREYNRLAGEVEHLANEVGEHFKGSITKLHSLEPSSYAQKTIREASVRNEL